MATAEQPGPSVDPRACGSAREFVRDRLADSDSPMGAVELYNEYGCTHGHMRDVLSDLAAGGVVERVATGRYALADGDADNSAEETDGSVPTISDDGIADLPAEHDDVDGLDDMPTQDEYRQQHSESEDGSADRSPSSELTGSNGNASASGGSDASDDSASVDVGGAPPTPLPMDPKALGTLLVVALGLWVAYRALAGGDTSEPEPEPNADREADNADGVDGGLLG